jgi:hypothetical protein
MILLARCFFLVSEDDWLASGNFLVQERGNHGLWATKTPCRLLKANAGKVRSR